MRALRDDLARAGVRACATCGARVEPQGNQPSSGVGFSTALHSVHPLDWLNIERSPALVWHGSPEAQRARAYMAATCRECHATTLFDRGWYTAGHGDLTMLSDEEQVEQDER